MRSRQNTPFDTADQSPVAPGDGSSSSISRRGGFGFRPRQKVRAEAPEMPKDLDFDEAVGEGLLRILG